MKNIIICIGCFFATVTALAQETENWSRFRGPNGQGISKETNLPVKWSAEENIAWKTDIPGEGWSSPVVWDEHIFVTSTTEDGKNCHVIAVDGKTGKIHWNKIVFTQEPEQFRHPLNSYATPTPVTDGKTVYAVFSGGHFVALDFDGNVRWINSDLNYYSQHGLGASPILYGDLLLFAVNPSSREEPKKDGWQQAWDKSYLLALDKNTGKERWRGKRGLTCIAHSTPVIMQVNGKDQIISSAGDVIQGFDPANGQLIWTVTNIGEPCVPSPAIGDGLVFSTPSNSAPIIAVRPDGQGDCTATHITWTQKENSPMMASFLFVKSHLYTGDNRNFNCLDASTGELVWRLSLRGGEIIPSPIYADGKIYVLSDQGTTTVLQLSADPKKPAEIIATNALKEACKASIVPIGKKLIIRTATRLWCIG